MLEFAKAPRVLVTPETFELLAAENDLLQLERSADGRLIVLPPAGSRTGNVCANLNLQLGNWNEARGAGLCFSAAAGFTLPNGAIRSPDASWISWERWNRVPADLKERFAPIAPDFAIELVSPSDRMADVRKKAREYVACGVRLTWIIDRKTRTVEVYRPGGKPERFAGLESISAEPELPGFELDLRPIFHTP